MNAVYGPRGCSWFDGKFLESGASVKDVSVLMIPERLLDLLGCNFTSEHAQNFVRCKRWQSSPIAEPEVCGSRWPEAPLVNQVSYSMFCTRCSFSEATGMAAANSKFSGKTIEKGETFMRKAVLLSAAITLCAGLALAQDTPSNGASGQNGTTTTTTQTTTDQSTSSNTIRGCLTGTSGNYMLTDATGISYKIKGDDFLLSS